MLRGIFNRLFSRRRAVRIAGAKIHVLVAPAVDGGYCAQGVNIDYVATGATEKEAMDRFGIGFTETLKAYMRRGRPLDNLLKSTPPPEIREAYLASEDRHILISRVEQYAEIPKDVGAPEVFKFRRTSSNIPDATIPA